MNMSICPQCARVHGSNGKLRFDWNSGFVEYEGKSTRLTRGQLNILEYIIDAGPKGVYIDKLVKELHGHKADGGPLTAIKSIHVQICTMRRAFREAGMMLDVVNWHVKGQGPGRYAVRYGQKARKYWERVA